MQDKLQEIRSALFALGYPETEPVELIMNNFTEYKKRF